MDLEELWYIGKGQGVKNISNNSCELNFPKPEKNALNKNEKDEEKKISTKDIEKFIKYIFIESKGSEYVDILSKDIHKAMGWNQNILWYVELCITYRKKLVEAIFYIKLQADKVLL